MKKTQKLYRTFIALMVLVFSWSILAVAAQSSSVFAQEGDSLQTSFIADEVKQRVEAKNYYMFLRYCFDQSDTKDELSESDVDGWDYFEWVDDLGTDRDIFAIRGNAFGPNTDATIDCENGDNVGNAFKKLGFSDSRRVFCALSGAVLVDENTLNDKEYSDDKDCYSKEISGGKHWDINHDDKNKLRESFEDLVKTSKDEVEGSGSSAWAAGGLADHEEYVRYYLSFMEQCGVGEADVKIEKPNYTAGEGDPDDKYQLPIVSKDGSNKDVLAAGQVSSGSQVAIQAEINGSEYKQGDGEDKGEVNADKWPKGLIVSCNSAIIKVRETAGAYATWVTEHPQAEGSNSLDDAAKVEDGESCWTNSGPLAWLLCSILDVVDGAISLIDTWVNNLLYIDADQYDDDGVRQGNAIMRNIALLMLVPAMMLMVIGTALNFGPFDPYTVKKALPRMFIATIFIVLSLPITQFGVEVSNVVGQGAGNLLLSAGGVPDNYSLGTILGESGSNDTFGGLLLAGGAAASSIVSIGVLLSFASVALVALLIAFVILVMRQVLLTLLIVLAPLAIIVWIFPGNDKLWSVWKGTFIAMLMMYPLISLLIASGKFVANLIG